MWYADDLLTPDGQPTTEGYLSLRYIERCLGKRPPLMVRLPGGMDFCLDKRADSDGGEHGWIIMGEAPNLTVRPSINVLGCYHGFIHQGVITDDCEGRTFKMVVESTPHGEGGQPFYEAFKRGSE